MNLSGALLMLSSLCLSQAAPTDFYQSFRNGHMPVPSLTLVGPTPETTAQPERGGLRIRLNLADKDKRSQAVGVMSKFAVSGDFEITGSYELLSVGKPANGSGVGVNLMIVSRTDPPRRAGVARLDRAKGDGIASVFSANFRSDEADKPAHADVATTSRSGQLRLLREGSSLKLLARDLSKPSFQEVLAVDYGREQVDVVRFVVTSGNGTSPVDARLVDLRINSSALPNLSEFRPDSPLPGIDWALVSMGALVCLSAACGHYLYRRRCS